MRFETEPGAQAQSLPLYLGYMAPAVLDRLLRHSQMLNYEESYRLL